jgi:hypothetical protein
MRKKFNKKKVLLRSARKDKRATVSIHRRKHRWFRKRLLAKLRSLALKTDQ